MSDDTALFAATPAILIAKTRKGLTEAEIGQIKPTSPDADGPSGSGRIAGEQHDNAVEARDEAGSAWVGRLCRSFDETRWRG